MALLSVVIITYNEEKNIGRCLESVQGIADEIVVIDSYSVDKTKEICNNYNVRFLEHVFVDFVQQKNWAHQQAKYENILSLDADEELSPTLREEIKKAKNNGFEFEGYSFNRITNYAGKWIKHCGWYPDTKIRICHKSMGQWQGFSLHEKLVLKDGARIKHLKGDLLHYTYYNLEHHLNQIIKYALISAQAKYSTGKKTGLILMVVRPLFTFIKKYFIKTGFLDGYYGFVISALTAYGTFQKDILLREMYKQNKP